MKKELQKTILKSLIVVFNRLRILESEPELMVKWKKMAEQLEIELEKLNENEKLF